MCGTYAVHFNVRGSFWKFRDVEPDEATRVVSFWTIFLFKFFNFNLKLGTVTVTVTKFRKRHVTSGLGADRFRTLPICSVRVGQHVTISLHSAHCGLDCHLQARHLQGQSSFLYWWRLRHMPCNDGGHGSLFIFTASC